MLWTIFNCQLFSCKLEMVWNCQPTCLTWIFGSSSEATREKNPKTPPKKNVLLKSTGIGHWRILTHVQVVGHLYGWATRMDPARPMQQIQNEEGNADDRIDAYWCVFKTCWSTLNHIGEQTAKGLSKNDAASIYENDPKMAMSSLENHTSSLLPATMSFRIAL